MLVIVFCHMLTSMIIPIQCLVLLIFSLMCAATEGEFSKFSFPSALATSNSLSFCALALENTIAAIVNLYPSIGVIMIDVSITSLSLISVSFSQSTTSNSLSNKT
ncbi:hypothetical protein U1Q18_004125 [Sarracenia purpurea var. burkii]